jgi:hypothetical protein
VVAHSGVRSIFACGLPGWARVCWVFDFIEPNRDASIADIAGGLDEFHKK